MCRIGSFIFTFLNSVLVIFGIAAIAASVYIHAHHQDSECQKALQNPLLVIGVFLFVISLLGLIGSCFNVPVVLFIYSFVTFFWVIGLTVFTVFAYVVTNRGAGKQLSGLGYKEYRLGDYSEWLRRHFVNGKNWEEIRSCLNDAHVCSGLRDDSVNQKVADFYKKKLSPIQSGCCKPPKYCGFEYKNATFWLVPKSGPVVPDVDCRTWSNEQDKLCYDCNSCKGGVLANIRKDWRLLTIINVCFLAFILIMYSISCCTRRDLRSSRPKYYYYQGYHP